MLAGKFKHQTLIIGLTLSALFHLALVYPDTRPLHNQVSSIGKSSDSAFGELSVKLSNIHSLQGELAGKVESSGIDAEFKMASQNLDEKSSDVTGVRYFDYAEVDAPAVPVDEWVVSRGVNEETFSVDLEIYISRSGQIVSWKLLPSPISSQASSQAYEALNQIGSTPMIPALRNGLAVASVRRLKISI